MMPGYLSGSDASCPLMTGMNKDKNDMPQDNTKARERCQPVLERLYHTVTARKGASPSVSHSARLMARGRSKIAQKFGEEAVECVIEAIHGDRKALISESADVLYHLIVMWVDAGIDPADVWAELERREGTSGIEEKASRPKSSV